MIAGPIRCGCRPRLRTGGPTSFWRASLRAAKKRLACHSSRRFLEKRRRAFPGLPQRWAFTVRWRPLKCIFTSRRRKTPAGASSTGWWGANDCLAEGGGENSIGARGIFFPLVFVGVRDLGSVRPSGSLSSLGGRRSGLFVQRSASYVASNGRPSGRWRQHSTRRPQFGTRLLRLD